MALYLTTTSFHSHYKYRKQHINLYTIFKVKELEEKNIRDSTMESGCGVTLLIGVVLLAGVVIAPAHGQTAAPLRVGFYNGKCKGNADVEAIVRTVVTLSFLKDPTIAPALVRMQFHDCFVNVRTLFSIFFLFIIYTISSFHFMLNVSSFLTFSSSDIYIYIYVY